MQAIIYIAIKNLQRWWLIKSIQVEWLTKTFDWLSPFVINKYALTALRIHLARAIEVTRFDMKDFGMLD